MRDDRPGPLSFAGGTSNGVANRPTGGESSRPLLPAEALRRLAGEADEGVYESPRYRCRYFSWGAGPALLFVHGLSDRGRSFVLLSGLLSDEFRCIAYDLPTGQGDGASLSQLTHADLAADAWGLLDHLGVERCHLFGSSFGSTVALRMMTDRPGRVRGAVLQGGFARRPLVPMERFLARLLRHVRSPLGSLPLRDLLTRRFDYLTFADRPPEVWEYFRRCSGQTPCAAVAQRALLLDSIDLTPALPSIRQPTLLVCGEHDPLVGRECERVLEAGLRNPRRVVIDGCGHYPQYTHPETTARLVRSFLRADAGRP